MATEHAQLANWKNALLPHVVDRLAQIKPRETYAEYPVSPVTYDQGFRKITWREFANAINGVAHWLSTTLGPSTNHEVLTYIGPNDIRYIVLILGAVKAGYVMFLTSPRNSIAAHRKLFERLKCTKLLSPDPKPPTVTSILGEVSEVQHVAVPSLEYLLDQDHPHYEYGKTFEQARWEPLMIIHTSGSTGFPKPLIYTHESGARNMNAHAENPPAGGFQLTDRLVEGKRVLNCFPPFHGAGIVSHLFAAIPFGTVLIAPLSGAIPTAQGVFDALHQTSANAAFLVPSIVLELSQDDSLLDYCSQHLERCLYAGGDLPQAVGDKVAAKLPLVCQYGASEIGLTPQLLSEAVGPFDWKYVHYHPCLGIEFRQVANGNYELYVKYDSAKEQYQPTFTIFPGTTEYGSRDLFKPHPTLPNMWAWCARADDIIVFLNGEKTNPISMEQHIVARDPETILSAIVVGAQRFQAALLLEPSPNAVPHSISEEAALIEKVWPTVQEANNVAPAHARIEKSMILVLSPDKPVIRAGKGTIQRAATLEQCSADIDKLYRNVDQRAASNDEIITEPQDLTTVSKVVRTAIEEVLEQPGITNDDNFFAIGTDSLRALYVARRLRNIFQIPEITVSTIYSNPSVTQLSEVICSLQINRQAAQTLDRKARKEVLTSILDIYKAKVHEIIPSSQKEKDPEKQSVVLTGTTGTLGTYLLDSLLENPTVEHVYCLNRRNNARELYLQHSKHDENELDQKTTFIQADFGETQLGLAQHAWELIRGKATVIIHNAWPVNFNLSLETFRPQLTGLIELFSLAAEARHQTQFFYVSSISSVLGIRDSSGVTPETIINNIDAPFSNGYAESKFISEILCQKASRHLSIPVSIARVGQIAGPVSRTGTVWNPTEWFPSLMVSSIKLGLLPDSLGASMNRIDWIPVDLLSNIIIELSVTERTEGNKGKDTCKVFHLVNPTAATWQTILSAAQAILEESIPTKSIRLVPASSWLGSLQIGVESVAEAKMEDGELEALVRTHPAIKLFNFFATIMTDTDNGANRLDLSNSLDESSGIRQLPSVGEPWLRKWIVEWLPLTKP